MTNAHFIPFRKSDIVTMCLQDSGFDSQRQGAFADCCSLLQSIFHFEFYRRLEQLKDRYAPLNPDTDTRSIAGQGTNSGESFPVQLESLLQSANYVKLGVDDLQHAMAEHALFKIKLKVNFSDFAEVLMYCRGESQREEEVAGPLGFGSKCISFTNYDRVVVYIKFKPDFVPRPGLLPDCQPGTTVLKLFQNVPSADLEMLFPNTEVRMRSIDRLLLGVPALVSGTAIISTKLGTTLVLIGSLIGVWLGLNNRSVVLDKASVLALVAGLGALLAYLWKQLSKFRSRKTKFLQILTENLYFKNLDNNAGVLHHLLDAAEEEECKEAILAYYALLRAEQPLDTEALGIWLQHWFKTRWQCQLDFDSTDALDKLKRLGLLRTESDGWRVPDPAEASAILGGRWNQLFRGGK